MYLTQAGQNTVLTHAISFSHTDPCDLQNGATIPLLTDYTVRLSAMPKTQLAEYLTKQRGPEFVKENFSKDWFLSNKEEVQEVIVGSHKAARLEMGAEGCGLVTYIVPLSATQVVIAEQPFGNITSQLFGGDETKQARQLPDVILAEDVTKVTERILASLTTVQSTGSVVGFIRPASSSEMVAYSSENNFSFRYPSGWLARVTPRSYAIDYEVLPNLKAGLIAPSNFQATNHLLLKSAASTFINAETEGFTVAKESVLQINNQEWNQADYIRLPGGAADERRVIAIGPHPVREDLGFLVQLNYPLDKEKDARAIFERVLSTIGPRP